MKHALTRIASIAAALLLLLGSAVAEEQSKASETIVTLANGTSLTLEEARNIVSDLTDAKAYQSALSYLLAIDQANSSAYSLSWIAYCYDQMKEYDQALPWYRKAAELGDSYSMNAIGFYYHMGWAVEKDDSTAVAWYEKAGEAGYSKSYATLGDMYNYATYHMVDIDKALEYYKKAAESEDADSMTKIGLIYQTNDQHQDYEQAMTWYQAAAAKGDGEAMHRIGELYEHGEGVTKDGQQAVQWYEKAAELDNAPACYHLAWYYREGQVYGQSSEKAEELYQRAITLNREQGNGMLVTAVQGLAELYSSQKYQYLNLPQAISLYEQLAEEDDAGAMVSLAALFIHGDDPQTINAKKAEEWYQKAVGASLADKEDDTWQKAVRGLADLYSYEFYDYLNLPRAVALYEQLADKSSVYAMVRLGGMYCYAAFTEIRDYQKAAEWYEKAFTGGEVENTDMNRYGLYQMGNLHTYENYGMMDYAEGLRWYQRAADMGSGDAMKRLGDLYLDGKGTERDAAKAREWYEKAVDAGGTDAKEALETLNK